MKSSTDWLISISAASGQLIRFKTTALVHEAYVRLVGEKNIRWQNRAHFFGIAASLMRRILVDYARSHHAAKRRGGEKVSIQEANEAMR